MIPNMPVVRDPDSQIYFKENEGRLLAGSFETKSKPAFEVRFPRVDGIRVATLGRFQDGLQPRNFKPGDIPEDWDHFYTALDRLLFRVPSLETAFVDSLTNDPEPYSPDGEWIVGEAPDVRNYFVAAAMRSSGASAAGGVGELIADFITQGRTPFDMYNLDIQRFLSSHNNRSFLRDRVVEVPGRLFRIPYPFLEYTTGTALRTSPIFTKLKQAGARFNQVMGYERPMYFKPDSDEPPTGGLQSLEEDSRPLAVTLAKSDTFFKPPWFKFVEDEFVASREACSLCDYSSFAKTEVWSGGLEVVDFLQRLCSSDVDVPIGSVVHTGMQNEDGGYQNDCTLARLAVNRLEITLSLLI